MSILTISGGVFNFLNEGYTPTSWSGGVYDFDPIDYSDTAYISWVDEENQWTGVDTAQWIDEYSDRSVDINDIGAFINYAGGFTTVWANDSIVFLGTPVAGIKYLFKSDITASKTSPVDLSDYLYDYDEYELTSKCIRYIHGNGSYMAVCTISGVDVIKMGTGGYISFTTTSGARKCFMTSTGKFYYTVSGTNEWSLNRVDTSLYDWVMPDYSLVTGSGIFPAGLKINDIFITEGTSIDTIQNTIFMATSSGVYVFDEGDIGYDVYYKI